MLEVVDEVLFGHFHRIYMLVMHWMVIPQHSFQMFLFLFMRVIIIKVALDIIVVLIQREPISMGRWVGRRFTVELAWNGCLLIILLIMLVFGFGGLSNLFGLPIGQQVH